MFIISSTQVPRGEYSSTLMRRKTRHRRCTEKYKRQEICLGICLFNRLHSSSERACSLWAKQKAGDDAGPPCKTLQSIFDAVCPSPVLLFKYCYSAELGTPNKQRQASLELQKGEHTGTCRLSPGFCSWWNEHGFTLPWLTEPPPPPNRGLLVFLFLINSTASNFDWEAVFYLLFPNFPSLLQCTVLTLLSALYIIYHIHLFCHLIFAYELSFGKSDFAQKNPNKSVSQKKWMKE